MKSDYLKQKLKFVISRHLIKIIRLVDSFYLKRNLENNDNLILIYSIGKVGSTTILKSIKKSSLKLPVFHIHALNLKNIDYYENYYLKSERKSIPFHLIRSRNLERYLKSYKGDIYIITLIREPIERELSSLFQDYLIFNNTYNQFTDSQDFISTINRKIKRLINSLPEEKWFDTELKNIFGIDIFNFEFDSKKGYFIYKRKNINFILIRLENLNSLSAEVLNNFLGIENFQIEKGNIGSEKFYSDFYKKIKKAYKIEPDSLNLVLESRYIQKFYRDKIDQIKKHWL